MRVCVSCVCVCLPQRKEDYNRNEINVPFKEKFRNSKKSSTAYTYTPNLLVLSVSDLMCISCTEYCTLRTTHATCTAWPRERDGGPTIRR